MHLPLALLENFQYSKCCVFTRVSFSFNFFMGTALTLRMSTSSSPCVSEITVIVIIESFKGGGESRLPLLVLPD